MMTMKGCRHTHTCGPKKRAATGRTDGNHQVNSQIMARNHESEKREDRRREEDAGVRREQESANRCKIVVSCIIVFRQLKQAQERECILQ